jgi:cytidine deaminase
MAGRQKAVSMTRSDYAALIAAAHSARERAYAPYSNFYVGAAALTASGKIFLGGNIENAAYPMTICAERVALFSAYAAGEREIVALAVVTPTSDVASPCGACRQVIFELAPRSEVLLLNLSGAQRVMTPQELLPHGFGGRQLEEAAQ